MIVRDRKLRHCKSKRTHGGNNQSGYCVGAVKHKGADFDSSKHCHPSKKICKQVEFRMDGTKYYPETCWYGSSYSGLRGGPSLANGTDYTPAANETGPPANTDGTNETHYIHDGPCENTPSFKLDWIDVNGNTMDCNWFEQSPGRCDIYGEVETGRGTANLNCCVCSSTE